MAEESGGPTASSSGGAAVGRGRGPVAITAAASTAGRQEGGL